MLLSSGGSMLLYILCSLLLLPSIIQVNAEPKVFSLQTKQILRSSALQKRDTGDVVVDHVPNTHLINVTVGTPPQPETLILDTGSSDIWLLASEVRIDQPMPELDEDAFFCKSITHQYLGQFSRIHLTDSIAQSTQTNPTP